MIITGAVTIFQVLLPWRKSRAISTLQLCWGLIPTTAQGRRNSKLKVFIHVVHPYITARTASCDVLKVCTMPQIDTVRLRQAVESVLVK